ncbi:hypothetical protein WJX84_003513 [Apatococcus fuscideae]|uniref:dihydropyrimidinase n=1 Tax=Apatococcus fuscideae TaxID=2026836 RepID=A0AAW1T550_9CHLO
MGVAAVLVLFLASFAASAEASALHLKGGVVVNADQETLADLLIDNGKVLEVGPPGSLMAPDAEVIDASGKYIMPGGIDTHTHLDSLFMGQNTPDDFFSGQAAALAGGTTCHLDMVMPQKGGDILGGYARYREAAKRSVMDYSFHIVITHWNDQVEEAMGKLVEQGLQSFKFFMAYKGKLQVSDELLAHAFRRCRQLGAIPLVHAENGDAIDKEQQRLIKAGITGPEGHQLSRPPIVEEEATFRAVMFANLANVPLFVVHVMSRGAMEVIAKARTAGQRVIGETLASAIGLNQSLIWSSDFTTASKFVMSPPIRTEEHRLAVRAGLAGGALQLVATDHCGWTSAQKALGRESFLKMPNGVNGIEERMHVAWQQLINSGLASPSRFVEVTSTAAAKVFNLYPQKGVIQAGADADVILLDPNAEHTISASSHHSKGDINIFEGNKIRGKVVMTISQGKVVWDGSSLHVQRGAGRFLPRPAFGDLYKGLDERDAIRSAEMYPYGPVPVKRDLAALHAKQEL